MVKLNTAAPLSASHTQMRAGVDGLDRRCGSSTLCGSVLLLPQSMDTTCAQRERRRRRGGRAGLHLVEVDVVERSHDGEVMRVVARVRLYLGRP